MINPEALFSNAVIARGIIVREINVERPQMLDVTMFNDTSPQYVAGLPGKIRVDIDCTPQGFQNLVAAIIGVQPQEVTVPDRPIIEPTARKVQL